MPYKTGNKTATKKPNKSAPMQMPKKQEAAMHKKMGHSMAMHKRLGLK